MVQRRQQLRLALEARQPIRMPRERDGQNLDRDLSAEIGVRCTVDFPHPARTNQRGDVIRAEGGAEGQRHGEPA
jgi:hypothetical protein